MTERTSLLGDAAQRRGSFGAARAAPPAASFFAATLSLPARVRGLLCGRRALTYADILASPASAAVAEDVAALTEAASSPGLGSQGVRGALEALWGASLGAGGAGALPCPPALSPQWALLGFQGADPTRDLRSATFPLALALATAGLRSVPALRREALLAALGAAPPFALCVLSTVHMLACHLKLLGGSGGGGGGVPAAAPPPPSFCPCCGASVREREYGRLALQSHRGASLRGFVEVVREAGREGGGGSGGGGGGGWGGASALAPHRPPGEVALGEVLQLAVRALGEEWRRQGQGEGALALEGEEALLARLRLQQAAGEAAAAEAAAAGGASARAHARAAGADPRHLGFPAMLAGVQRRVMEALAQASLPVAEAAAIRRSHSEAVGGGKGGGGGGGGARSGGLRAASPQAQAQLSPLHAAAAAAHSASAGGGAPAPQLPAPWGAHARRCLQDALAPARA